MTSCVVDFHCDLLSYLAQSKSADAALHPDSNCSLLQLHQGRVIVQTLAIFTETRAGSTRQAAMQFEHWHRLLKAYRHQVKPFDQNDDGRLRTLLAIENASGLLEEDEPIELAFSRIEKMRPILYISLTWNGENRFGGGSSTKVGLKPDGLRLLEYLAGKKIAIDLSHASDPLAADIIEAIDKKKLALIPIASHSNFRVITPVLRIYLIQLHVQSLKEKGLSGSTFSAIFLALQRKVSSITFIMAFP